MYFCTRLVSSLFDDVARDLGSLKHATAVFNPDSLQELLGRFGCVDEDEIPGVVAFMRKCLTLDPRLRQSARQLLEDDWLA